MTVLGLLMTGDHRRRSFGAKPNDGLRASAWRKAARPVAAYRDCHRMPDDAPLGVPPESAAQEPTPASRKSHSRAAELT